MLGLLRYLLCQGSATPAPASGGPSVRSPLCTPQNQVSYCTTQHEIFFQYLTSTYTQITYKPARKVYQ
jgi:hypothetical protein